MRSAIILQISFFSIPENILSDREGHPLFIRKELDPVYHQGEMLLLFTTLSYQYFSRSYTGYQ